MRRARICKYLHAPTLPDRRTPPLTASSTDDKGLVVLGEEILIQTFELDCPAGADPDPMFDHQVCQALAIEQDDTLGQVLHKFARLRTERRRGHEDALRRSETDQAPAVQA